MVPSLDIVIVNWNAGRQLVDCLASIEAISRKSFQLTKVVVVDNGSSDDSLEFESSFSFALQIIKNTRNRGFGAACNQGAAVGDSQYILFLNPDTTVFADSLELPLKWMDDPKRCDIGICGIQLVDENGSVSKSCGRIPTPAMFFSYTLGLDRFLSGLFPSHFMTEWPHDENRAVDHVIGAFYLVRRTLFTKLNGFDERFFVYLEDLDFSCRAKAAGYTSFFLASAKAFHKGGGTSEKVKALRLFYSLRCKIIYSGRHFGRFSFLILLLLTLFVEPVIRLLHACARRSAGEISATLKAYWLLIGEMPAFFKLFFQEAGLSADKGEKD